MSSGGIESLVSDSMRVPAIRSFFKRIQHAPSRNGFNPGRGWHFTAFLGAEVGSSPRVHVAFEAQQRVARPLECALAVPVAQPES